MNFETEKEKIVIPHCFCEDSATQSIEAELNLPDYCSDIKRILKCLVLPSINSVQVTGDRVSAQGETLIRLIYVDENEKIDCYEQGVDLSACIDVRNMPESVCVRASAKTEYVNCRAASQRRAVVNGSISVSFRLFCEKETTLPCDVKDSTMQLCKQSISAVTETAIGEKTFDMSETVELSQEKPAVGRVISQDAFAVLQSVKAVSGKLLIKGELTVCILYFGDNEQRQTERIRHTMPISQIIEIPGLDEEATNNVRLSVRALAVQPKADSAGKCRLVEIAAKLSCFVTGTVEKQIDIITDCYCTKYEMKPEYKNIDFLSLVHTLERRQSVKAEIEVSDRTPVSVVDARVCSSSCSVNVTEDKLDAKGSAVLEIIFNDSDGKLQCAQRTVDFALNDTMRKPCAKIRCDPAVTVEQVDCSVASQGKLSVNMEIYVLADVFAVDTRRVCTVLELDGEKEKPSADCALTVCFCDKGEKIWDIAKKYNTEVSCIKEENSLTGDVLTEDMMLMIPSA